VRIHISLKNGREKMPEIIFLICFLASNLIWVIWLLLKNYKSDGRIILNESTEELYLALTSEEFENLKTIPDGSYISLKFQRVK